MVTKECRLYKDVEESPIEHALKEEALEQLMSLNDQPVRARSGSILIEAFEWQLSNQGHAYWLSIYQKRYGVI